MGDFFGKTANCSGFLSFRPARILAGLFFLVLIAVFGLSSLAAESKKTVRVSLHEGKPGIFLDEFGEPSGFFVDILGYIGDAEGWLLEYVPGTWSEGLQRLQEGSVDLVTSIAFTPEREKIYSYSRIPALSAWSAVYVAEGSGIDSLLDLRGKSVAVMRNTIQEAGFRTFIEGFDLNIEFVSVSDQETAFSMVAGGNADAAIEVSTTGEVYRQRYGLGNTSIVFNAREAYYAVSKGDPLDLLPAIDRMLAKMKGNPDSFYYETLNRWFPKEKNASFMETWMLIVMAAVFVCLLLSLILLAVLRWQVTRRTAELLAAKEAAEEARRAEETQNIRLQREIVERKRIEDELKRHKNLLEELVSERTADLTQSNSELQREIYERKHIEEELRAAFSKHEELSFIVNHSPAYAFLWFIESGWPVKYVSENVGALLGYEADDFLSGRVFFEDIVHPDDLDRMNDEIGGYLAAGFTEYSQEYRVVRKDGEVRWVDDKTWIRTDEKGHPVLIQGILWDITERKKTEDELKKYREELERLVGERTSELALAKEEAERANKAKSAFLANMSHEIRTPLNAILGFGAVLQRDPSLSEKQAEYIGTINRSGRHLLKLINDILDMSRIEADHLALSITDFSLHDLLDDLEMMFRARAEEKGLMLSFEVREGVPPYARGDEAKLRQVLVNLLGNAMKFTKSGGVALRIGMESNSDKSSPDGILIEVEDSGPAIPQDELVHIFDAFRQSEAGRETGGTGLGLTISKRLAELMGGTLTARSTTGVGSCFALFAPLTPVASPPVHSREALHSIEALEPGTGPYRILIVDDATENRDVLRAMLSLPGFELQEAKNGREALDVFSAWSPHAVLMDMRMPVMDGYEATRRIKASERPVPVIAITASAFEDDVREVMNSGADICIRKPLRPEELFESLGRSLDLRFVYTEESSPPASGIDELQTLVRTLPDNLAEAMKAAVEDGDILGLEELIDRVQERDERTANGLLALARRYDYDTLNTLLSR